MIASLITSLAIVPGPVPAGAFSETSLSCPPVPLTQQTVNYGFFGPDWVDGASDYRPFARVALEEWETTYRDSDGSTVVTMTEEFSGGWVALIFDPDPGDYVANHPPPPGDPEPNPLNGIAICDPSDPPNPPGSPPPASAVIELLPDLRSNLAELLDVVQHEMGHVLGLHHTGDEDNLIGLNPPIMATCQVSGSSARSLGNDDGSSLRFRRGSGAVLSNDGSFESASSTGGSGSTFGWTATNASLTRSTSTPYLLGGANHGRYTPAGSLNLLWQATNRVTPSTSKARVAYRKLTSGASGALTLTFERRDILYGVAAGCTLNKYQIPYNQNVRSSGAWVQYVPNQVLTPTTSWQIAGSPNAGTGNSIGDWRVGVASSVTSGGAYATVAVDLLQGFDS